MKQKNFIVVIMMMIGIVGISGCNASTSSVQGERSSTQLVSASPMVAEATVLEAVKESTPKEKVTIQVFIAASLKNAMEEIQTNYKEIHPEIELIFNADSSGTLQTQIEEGATCDVFFSAAMKQMNALDEGSYVMVNSSVKLLENQVVLIKPKGSETKVTGFENITEAANLALAGEDVPVGGYSREIFTNLGILDQVMAMEINEGTNVSAVLAAVSEASNEIGVVYATDAYSVLDSVEIIEAAPVGSLEQPVIYPVGMIKNEGADEIAVDATQSFISYLSTEEAIKVFESYGFSQYQE